MKLYDSDVYHAGCYERPTAEYKAEGERVAFGILFALGISIAAYLGFIAFYVLS